MLFIFPMGGKTFLGNLVHTATADLYFHPLSVGSHHGQVQRLITVCFRTAHPVADAVGTDTVNIGNSRVDVPALVFLIHSRQRVEDNADSVYIVDILKADAFTVHLVPDGIGGLNTGAHLIV